MSKFSPNTLHLENSEEAAIVVTTAHHYCAASSGHEECGAPDGRPSSQVSASQLRAANHWNVSRNVSYHVHCIVYRIVSWARRIVSALLRNITRPHGWDMGCPSWVLQWKFTKINRECIVFAISETKVLGVVFIGIIHLANSHWQNSVTSIEGLVLCVTVLLYSHGSHVVNWRLYVFYAFWKHVIVDYSDGLVQERCNSSALAMELRLSCTNPSICLI